MMMIPNTGKLKILVSLFDTQDNNFIKNEKNSDNCIFGISDTINVKFFLLSKPL